MLYFLLLSLQLLFQQILLQILIIGLGDNFILFGKDDLNVTG